jgi:molecular chaperone DnaK (HSP70)
MSHVFISYVRENSRSVDRLVHDLRQAGVAVWLDRDAIQPGARWNEAIESAIRGGAFFVACFSREYLGRSSTYMDQELALAKWLLSNERLSHNWFLPVLLNHCSPAELGLSADERLRTIQVVDMAGDWQDGLRRILGVVEPERAHGRCRSSPRSKPSVQTTEPCDQPLELLAIDFGTSYSIVSYHSPNEGWQPIRDSQGRALHPSVIAFTDNWDYFAGWDAVSAAQSRPERAIFNFKRRLGTDLDFEIGHKRFDPVTIAALMIRYLCDCAETQLGYSVRNVLVSRPADFSARQCQALADAFRRADLTIRRFLAEPNAAAMVVADWAKARYPNGLPGNGASQSPSIVVLVIDVGGGTTDVSVIVLASVENELQVEVVAVGGDNELGGMDYDEAAFGALRSKAVEPRIREGMVWTTIDDHRLRIEAGRAKRELAKADVFPLTLADIEVAPGELGSLDMKLDRHSFCGVVRPLDIRLASLIDKVLDSSGINWYLEEEEVPIVAVFPGSLVERKIPFVAVLLAGQGARIFTIARYLQQRFPRQKIVSDFQENAVSRGLTDQVSILTGHRGDLLLLDILSHPILVRVAKLGKSEFEGQGSRIKREWEELRGRFDEADEDYLSEVSPHSADNRLLATIIKGSDSIPTKAIHRFRVANAGKVTFDIVEGSSDGARAATLLASMIVNTVSAGKEYVLEVDVSANLEFSFKLFDRDGGSRKEVAEATYWHG